MYQRLRTTVALKIEFEHNFSSLIYSELKFETRNQFFSQITDSLVSKLAQVIDYSIAATKTNNGLRSIQICYYKDFDNQFKDSFLLIVDNGRGLGVNDLQNWSRLKFSTFKPTNERHPRHLNSDLNCMESNLIQTFFNIGNTLTVLSKSNKSIDSVELTISKKRFGQSVHNRPFGSVYREPILIRSKGVEREAPNDLTPSESIITKLFKDFRKKYKSFTIFVIKELFKEVDNQFQKHMADKWSKQLATIYHYYIHGPKGNISDENTPIPSDQSQLKISVQLNSILRLAANRPYSLRPNYSVLFDKINDDFESLLVRSAVDCFKFEILHSIKSELIIEGIIRYHPYLYERETLPQLSEQLSETALGNGHRLDYSPNLSTTLHNTLYPKISYPNRKLFDVFWNGRLIPEESVDFDWAKYDSKNPNTKGFKDCFKRLSGALFSDSCLKISPNKQSLVDLNKLLVMKEYLSFYCVNQNGERLTIRTNIENAFIKWIKSCHEKYDKEVLYQQFQG